MNDVAQPDDLAGGRERSVLELVVLTAGERRAALGHHLGPVLRVDALAEEVRLVEPAVGREPEDRLGALAHEGEAEGRGVRLPHDGVESLHQVLESLLGFLARRLQALLLGQVLDDEQQPRLLLLFDADARDRDPHPARLLPVEDLELEREVVLRRARLHHLARPAHQSLGTHEVLQLAPHDFVAAQEEGLEEGAVRREHPQVGRQEQQSRGHRGDDLLGVALQVEDRALLLHLLAQERRALALAPQAEQQAPERQRQECRAEARQPARLVEVRQRLLAVHLEHEAPAGGGDPAGGREDGRGAVVEDLAEGVAALGGALRQRAQRFERAVHGGPPGGIALERGDIGRLDAVRPEEEGLAGLGRHCLVRQEREEPRLGSHHERDDAHDRPREVGPALGEDGHAHEQELARGLLDEIHAHRAGPRGDHGGLAVVASELGGAGGAREEVPLGVHERDARVAVRGGDAVELLDDLAADVAPPALEHERAHGRGSGPVGDKTRAPLGDGGDAGLPVGEDGLALVLDLVPDERRDEGGAEEERREVAPGEALARVCARRPHPSRSVHRLDRQLGEVTAAVHA